MIGFMENVGIDLIINIEGKQWIILNINLKCCMFSREMLFKITKWRGFPRRSGENVSFSDKFVQRIGCVYFRQMVGNENKVGKVGENNFAHFPIISSFIFHEIIFSHTCDLSNEIKQKL